MKYYLISIGVLISFSVKSQSIVTDRPGQSDASTVLPENSFQMETGFSFDEDAGNNQTLYLPIALFRIALSKKIEFRILSKVESFKDNLKRTTGFGDIELGTKIQLFDKENKNIKLAFVQHVSFATGSSAFSSPDIGSTSKLLVSHNLGDNFGLAYNIIYFYSNSVKGELGYTLNFSYGLNNKLSMFLESYGGVSDSQDFNTNIDSGFAYLVNDNLQLDFSYGVGLTQQMNYIAFGCSWKLSKNNLPN